MSSRLQTAPIGGVRKHNLAALLRVAFVFGSHHQELESNSNDTTAEIKGPSAIVETHPLTVKKIVAVDRKPVKSTIEGKSENKESDPEKKTSNMSEAPPPANQKSASSNNKKSTRRSERVAPEPSSATRADAKEIRDEMRHYIRNERDTDLRKLMALTETLKLEDKRRSDFHIKEMRTRTRVIPEFIEKFIRSLKQACKSKIVSRGGNPYSVIRQAFVYWDSAKNGTVSAQEIHSCVKSIGVRLSDEDVQEVMDFYHVVDGRMSYEQLLQDVQKDEPTALAIPTQREVDHVADPRLLEPVHRVVPKQVQYFIEAVRSALANQMRDYGGTVESLLRHAFLMSDSNYSNGLDVKELMKCVHSRLGLSITEEQAREVLRFYDSREMNEIDYHALSRDVTSGAPQFIEHPEMSARSIQSSYKALMKNPFVPKPFKPVANKTVEKFKKDLRECLELRIKAKGGSVKSWVSETFVKYDPTYTGKISDHKALQGAMRRLGVMISEDDAKAVMRCYDTHSEGKLDYHAAIRDIVSEESNFLNDGVDRDRLKATTASITSRAPENVTRCVKKLRAAVNPFGSKTKGEVNPRDVLHGTFLRFDASGSGRLGVDGVKAAFRELRISASDQDIAAMISWYDTNGSNTLDYGDLTKQFFGDDPFLRKSSSMMLSSSSSIQRGRTDLMGGSVGSMTSLTRGATTLPPVSGLGSDKDKYATRETRIQKETRTAIRRNQILSEKIILEQKLHALEKQRTVLLDSRTNPK